MKRTSQTTSSPYPKHFGTKELLSLSLPSTHFRASYFKSISYKTNLVNNVFFNSPRSLVNYNDAFRGGDLMMGNVMWGAVKETADHASFNSWDRQVTC